MKKTKLITATALLTAVFAISCVVAPAPPPRGHAKVRYVSGVKVHYVVRGGVRVYVVPRGIRVGDVIIVNGKRCTVRKVKRNRVRIVYPDGTRVWINVEFR